MTSSTCGSNGRNTTRRTATSFSVVRFADDFTVGFQHRDDADRFLNALRDRSARLGLERHPDKTRLIEFGLYVAERRRARRLGKPQTLTFLGVAPICATARQGRLWVRRKTESKPMWGQSGAGPRPAEAATAFTHPGSAMVADAVAALTCDNTPKITDYGCSSSWGRQQDADGGASAEPMPPAVRRTDQELAVHRTVGRLSGSECGLFTSVCATIICVGLRMSGDAWEVPTSDTEAHDE